MAGPAQCFAAKYRHKSGRKAGPDRLELATAGQATPGQAKAGQAKAGQEGAYAMIAFLKAVPFGIFLTLIVALFMGSGGATGGTLNIRQMELFEIEFYWSWYLFLGGTILTWFLLMMMGD